jgi:hypothetical protein
MQESQESSELKNFNQKHSASFIKSNYYNKGKR